MTSNMQDLRDDNCDVENLREQVLNYSLPNAKYNNYKSKIVGFNYISNACSSLNTFTSKMFCQCDEVMNMQTNQRNNVPQYNLQHSLSYINPVISKNYLDMSYENSFYGYEQLPNDSMIKAVYNLPAYGGCAFGSISQREFMIPRYAQNGLISYESRDPAQNIDFIISRKKRNQMSFTMKKIPSKNNDLFSIYGQEENVSPFACRADVIYKKILRDFRRYFINDFKDKTGFKDTKSDSLDAKAYELLEIYVNTVFGKDLSFREEIIFTLGTLIFSNFKTSDSKGRPEIKEVNKIHDTLYKFSITKVDRLLEDRSVGFLLKYFISDEDNKRAIIESSKVCEKSYQTAFDLIERRVNAALAAY